LLEIKAYTEGQLGVENLWEEYKIMEIDVDADRQLTSQKRRREATRLDSFIENDMTDSDSDDELVPQDEFSSGRMLEIVG
jgi:hypothetical protein